MMSDVVAKDRIESFEQAIRSVLTDMGTTMISKQQDYGPGNIAKFGELGVLVRASDKLERLMNLLQSGRKPNNESLEDTWLDLANYALIGLMVRRGLWGLPMEGDAVVSDQELASDPVLKIVAESLSLVPEYKTAGSAGLDLAVKEDVLIKRGDVTMAGTGVRVAIPPGYVGLIYSRSSTATKLRVTLGNKVGVIDSDYRGEIMLPLVYQGNDDELLIQANTRVAQLIVQPYARLPVRMVDVLDDTERGEGGFGSTGESNRQVEADG